MDYQNMTAPCGLDCFNCPIYLANTDEKIRKIVAVRLNVPTEKAVCHGCRNEAGVIAAIGRNKPCYIYQCIRKKEISLCCDCVDFPCDYLHPYADQADQRPHNTKVFNSCLIKKMGLEKWAQEKALNVKETYFKGNIKLND
ncbi:conserved hypothetical protein [Desulfofarcimen acetoxidans DSM 771]|uniref:DUF3795 domain-containing protein n=1 Tax=Desulfofarcimen acetoxidans (strain ATCC 49208 / DSM 771 / KCTC 5769 / VKM B-1644 / 5575) TaxID=485916 RepID=C8VXQ0_DESAS|nr:DUF3795 domain-containing protein [Desulfofarcimen acetoxidans]ACV62706.1 conserved hypothetical protein [Desulfofarcimen acetoxidans DSM 771]